MNVSRTAKVLSAALPLFALSPCALAVQEAVTTGPVVVTAAGYEQDTTEAPASVSVITHKEPESYILVTRFPRSWRNISRRHGITS